MKTCSRCKVCKPKADFNPKKNAPDGLNYYCKPCIREYNQARYKAGCGVAQRKATARSRYGVEWEQVEQDFEDQGRGCAICKTPLVLEIQTAQNKATTVRIDHDHATGKYRGLLCDSCNVGLGRFKDRADLLVAAANYLKEKGQ